MSFDEAVAQYRRAMDAYLELLQRGKLDSDYYRAGRRCRKALARVRMIAAQSKIVWDHGDGARTFY